MLNNPLRYVDPSGHWCESADGKWAHPGGCNDGIDGKQRFYGPGYTPDSTNDGRVVIENGSPVGIYIYGLGSIIYGKTYELGIKGWSFRIDRAHDEKTGQRHIHINGPKGQSWSQNEDGSPHDKGSNSPGSPPNSMKKTLAKSGIWDWDAKAKSFEKNTKKYYMVPIDTGVIYFESQFDRDYYMLFGEIPSSHGEVIINSAGNNTVIPRGTSAAGGIKIKVSRIPVPVP